MPTGHFSPGYIYGNPKIHKNTKDPPLRPIISQIGTPTYEIAKKLNDLLSPYMPCKYMIKSTQEFITVTNSLCSTGRLASLDVENLFTNVPVSETINIIADNVYRHSTLPAPDIPEELLRSLLLTCTTETPFKDPDGNIYLQTDGVSMGSPLGPLFANFYMCRVENNVIPSLNNQPVIYTRYVDDIFLVLRDINALAEIKHKFEQLSQLHYTYELEEKKSIAFLDVRVTRGTNKLETSVYTKPTNTGECINYNGIVPDKYKVSTIKTFLHRAYNTCSSWTSFSSEVDRVKQLLTNNNYPMDIIEREIKAFLDRKFTSTEETIRPSTEDIQLYFKNQMSSQYKQEEHTLQKIVSDHVTPNTDNIDIKLHIYYKCKTIKNLFIRNNPHKDVSSHVVYQYSCPRAGCQPAQTYIGYTECSLTDRVRNHAQNGAIRNHSFEEHNTKITTNEILQATTVLRHFTVKEELLIAEALLIKQENPTLNGQREGEARILSIF